jgi:bacteriocin-like protein
MSNDTVDPSKKDPQISCADDLAKTTNKGDAELSEEELKRVSGGKMFVQEPPPPPPPNHDGWVSY